MKSKNYEIVANEITKRYIDIIAGRNEKSIIGYKPSDIAMIGIIKSSVAEQSFSKKSFDEFRTIPSIGVNFTVDNDDVIEFEIKGQLYYKTKPTFEEQCEFLLEKHSRLEKIKFQNVEELKLYFEDKKKDPDYILPIEDIMQNYKCLYLQDFLPKFKIEGNPEENMQKINDEIELLISKQTKKIHEESVDIKSVTRNILDFLSEPKFKTLLDANSNKILPIWNIELYLKSKENDNNREITISVLNKTQEIELATTYDTSLYDASIMVDSKIGFIPTPLNSIKHDYSESVLVFGIGVNCSVDDTKYRLETNNIPFVKQYRVKTKDDFNKIITFDTLIQEPIKNLNLILESLKLHHKNLTGLYQKEKNNRSQRYNTKFNDEIDLFNQEINRFSDGIKLIENKSLIRDAFKLMNETFSYKSKYSGWRLFQIVFIVSEINDIVYSEYKDLATYKNSNIDNVDLIYFPTGGGKTETFLGCSFFTCFFDRLRGKHSGTSIFIKYPLRLLAAQQLDRVLLLITKANVILEKNKIDGEKFNVGFFTGSQNTPNLIDKIKCDELKGYPQEMINNDLRQIDVCPICGTEVNVMFNEKSWLLQHNCETCGNLPVLIVDNDIHRNPPTFIVSTIDKLSTLGTSKGFKSIFGKNFGYCNEHGYVLDSKGVCKCANCKSTISKKEVKDPVPTLFIQDELHLVNESLGTFASHYESFLQYYTENLLVEKDRKKIKYIAATATITDYNSHTRNLYSKNSRCFPVNIKGENFYSYVDENDVSRIIIGASLYGGSITDSMQKAITILRKLVFDLGRNKIEFLKDLINEGFDGTEKDISIILNDYLISIIYNNSKDDSKKIQAALENQGNTLLNSHNIPEYIFGEISGDVDFKVIKNIMHDIESEKNKANTKNLIVATSAISHGVDEDCFNQMFFLGLPNKTAEYIQAYSRVGRKYTGIVFDVIRIIRDRDRSFLKNFKNYHKHMNLLIEPVPINRWARSAIYSTLPGIVASLFIQHYSNSSFTNDTVKILKDNTLSLEQLKNDLYKIYEVEVSGALAYKEIIDQEMESIYFGLKDNSISDTYLGNTIKKYNKKNKSPMSSLRDIDQTLELQLKGGL